MKKITARNLKTQLEQYLAQDEFVPVLNVLVHFMRSGGKKRAAANFDLLIRTLKQNPELCRTFSGRFYGWLGSVHIYPAFVMLGIFSRNGFTRELAGRIYERFNPSYKDFNNLNDVFLYLFHSRHDGRWLYTLSLRQWLTLYGLLQSHADDAVFQTASRQLLAARLQAVEMLSVWVAAEALEPELIRISPRLLEADSDFVAIQREAAQMVEHYRYHTEPYDTAHLEVMFDQCTRQVEYLRRKGTGAGSGSSVKVAHLLERLLQTLGRLKILTDIQTLPARRRRLSIELCASLMRSAVEQSDTAELRKSSIKMLSKSITENTSGRGEHYITRDRSGYFAMLRSALGGGVLIALMALNKIHIGSIGFGEFTTSFLSGLNYGFGFMLIHALHLTVATKQPAMTAASFAEQVERRDSSGKAVDMKLAKLLIDVCRSQSVAVFGNVTAAMLVAALISILFTARQHIPLLEAEAAAYQLSSLDILTRPTLWYAAIAGIWLFCSGIISGFFDNRADYLDLRNRLTYNPILRRIMPAVLLRRFAVYMHRHYGALAGNFIFGMLLGMTGYFGHLTGLPLDIRHVAFSSANLGYAAISGHTGTLLFLYSFLGVLAIGVINLIVSFALALTVALRARDSRIDSFPKLISALWTQIRANPLQLLFPVQTASKGKE